MSVIATTPATRKTSRAAVTGDAGFWIGIGLAAFVLAIAIFGPFVAPHSPTMTVGIAGSRPGPGYPLGLDFEGRDVLSRVLYGGRSTLALATAATAITYVLGISVGLIAGYSRTYIDPLLMRTVDVLLSIPALLVMLLAVTGLGVSPAVLVLAASMVLFPGVARIVRSATLEVSVRGYVEAAIARGERTVAVLRREILPNIAAPIVADIGVRFSWSIILIASVNFLGLGIRPPTPDWGLMISENRVIIPNNPMSVIAPAVVLALLIIAVNLIGDGIVRRLNTSGGAR